MGQSVFAKQFRRIGASGLLRQFGETVTYHPRTGPSRTVTAMVEREVEVIGESGTPGQATVFRVKDDPNCGIASTEIDTGGDAMAFPLRDQEPDTHRRPIIRILSTANGMIRFMVQ